MSLIHIKQLDNYEMRVVSRRKKGEVVAEFLCYVLEGLKAIWPRDLWKGPSQGSYLLGLGVMTLVM